MAKFGLFNVLGPGNPAALDKKAWNFILLPCSEDAKANLWNLILRPLVNFDQVLIQHNGILYVVKDYSCRRIKSLFSWKEVFYYSKMNISRVKGKKPIKYSCWRPRVAWRMFTAAFPFTLNFSLRTFKRAFLTFRGLHFSWWWFHTLIFVK